MNKNTDTEILQNISDTAFAEFLKLCIKNDEEYVEEYLKNADETKIHQIKESQLNDQDWFLVYFRGLGDYMNIEWNDFELIKIYKNGDFIHFLEFTSNKKFKKIYFKTIGQHYEDFGIQRSDYKLYSYYDFYLGEEFLHRGSTQVIGIKLPKEFGI